MTIVDDLVSVDTLIEEHLTVEPINEYVQSCDIVAFNKICKLFQILSSTVIYIIYLNQIVGTFILPYYLQSSFC